MKTPTKKAKKIIYDTDKFGDIQCMNTEVLCMVARGEVDLNQIAINELAARGLDESGKWIGFSKAEEKFLEN